MEAHENQPALPLRPHTILGVCEGLGEDFGFNPTFLRVPLAAMVLWSIEYAVVAYLALGVVVFASRVIFPDRKSQAGATAASAQPEAANEGTAADLPLAA